MFGINSEVESDAGIDFRVGFRIRISSGIGNDLGFAIFPGHGIRIDSRNAISSGMREELFGGSEPGIVARHAAEQNRGVLLAHARRAVKGPLQEALDEPHLARARQRTDDHDLFRPDVALQVAQPEEVPLRLDA